MSRLRIFAAVVLVGVGLACSSPQTSAPTFKSESLALEEYCPNSSPSSDGIACTEDDCNSSNIKIHTAGSSCGEVSAPPEAFALFARDQISLGANVTVDGDVLVSESGLYSTASRLIMGEDAAIDSGSLVVADTVDMADGASAGTLATTTIRDFGATFSMVLQFPTGALEFPSELGPMEGPSTPSLSDFESLWREWFRDGPKYPCT